MSENEAMARELALDAMAEELNDRLTQGLSYSLECETFVADDLLDLAKLLAKDGQAHELFEKLVAECQQ